MAHLREDDKIEDFTRLHDVEVELGFTKSMGDYEFLRVDIRHRGTREGDETINEATDRVYRNLEEVLVKTVAEIDEALGPRGRSSQIHSNRT